jgi:hypothetical protein
VDDPVLPAALCAQVSDECAGLDEGVLGDDQGDKCPDHGAGRNWSSPVLSRAADLDAVIGARYPQVADSREFHDQYRELTGGKL